MKNLICKFALSSCAVLAGDFEFNAVSVGSFSATGAPPVLSVHIDHPGVKAGVLEFDVLVADQKVNVFTYPLQITEGTFTFATAWGDKLQGTYSATGINGASAGKLLADGTFQITSGTGLFTGASGGGALGAMIAFQTPTNGVSAITWKGTLTVPDLILARGPAGGAGQVTGPTASANDSPSALNLNITGAGNFDSLGNYIFDGSETIDFGVLPPPFPLSNSRTVGTFVDGASFTMVQDGPGFVAPDITDTKQAWSFLHIPCRIESGTGRFAGITGRSIIEGNVINPPYNSVSGGFYLTVLLRFPSAAALTAAGLTSDGTFNLNFTAPSGQMHRVESSADLKTWNELGAALPVGPRAFYFNDASAKNKPQQTYRVRSE